MRLRGLAEEPLHKLVGEAAWRGIRSMRQLNFNRAGQVSACPVRFHPIGYYRLRRELVCDHTRRAIVDYADAILRGDYPLMGYGSPHLGVNPDWLCDWVSGKDWPVEPSGKIQIVRHDGSDVKAPWELSRFQFGPVVAKACVLTGDRRYRDACKALLTAWVTRNPIGIGVNWTVAMEVALRSISLCLTIELLWPFTADEGPWLRSNDCFVVAASPFYRGP